MAEALRPPLQWARLRRSLSRAPSSGAAVAVPGRASATDLPEADRGTAAVGSRFRFL